MSFVGKLDKFRLSDLMQMIGSTGKTGRLSLTRRDGKGVIVFRQGKVIYAASTSARETLGHLLLCQGLIDEAQLTAALERQNQRSEETRLGTILVEMGVLDRDSLEAVVRQQIEDVVSDFLRWESGFFKFDLLRIPDTGEVAVDTHDFLLADGLGADEVLIGIAVKLDELEARHAADEVETDPSGETLELSATLHDYSLTNLTSLRTIMQEISSPQFTGEFTHQILSYAERLLKRGILFSVREHSFSGMGHFGIVEEDGAGHAKLLELTVPIDQPSILSETADRNATYCGPLESSTWNRFLVRELGGAQPSEVAALPLSVNGRVVLVFYGDNLPDDSPIGPLAELELLFLQAGLAMEKRLLQERIKHLERVERWRGKS